MNITQPPQQVDRFLSNDNQVIAIEAIVIVALSAYLVERADRDKTDRGFA